MTRYFFVKYLLSSLLVILTFGFCSYLSAQEPIERRKFVVLEQKGSGYERGLQHGQQLRTEIAEVYGKWKSNIERTARKNADTVLNAFRSSINFEPITRKFNPEILEEIKGIAAGSGQSYEDVYAFQLIDEFWIYLDQQNHENHHCSGIGVAGTNDQPAFIAQNLDLESYMHGYQILLHLPETKESPEQYIVSCAGLVALSGMNGIGVGVCLNTLMELKASKDGMPVAFIIRTLLAQKDPKQAFEFLTTVKHASGQNYILGISDNVYDFEASANQVVRYFPAKMQPGLVYHTNHALVNNDVKDWYQEYHSKVLSGQTAGWNSEARFASLEQRIGKATGKITPDLVKITLQSKDNPQNPICRSYSSNRGGFTFSSIIYTLTKRRSVQLTYGSPDQSEFVEYFFSDSRKL